MASLALRDKLRQKFVVELCLRHRDNGSEMSSDINSYCLNNQKNYEITHDAEIIVLSGLLKNELKLYF